MDKPTFKTRKLNKSFWGWAIAMSIIFPLYRLTSDGYLYPETWLVIPVAFALIALSAKTFGWPRWPIKK